MKVPTLDATRTPVSTSNGQRSGLQTGGGIPCRPNAAATLLVFIYFSIFARDNSRSLSRCSPNLPGKWQMVCDRTVKLLVSELFLGWEEGSKMTLSLCTKLKNAAWRQNGFRPTYRKKEAV